MEPKHFAAVLPPRCSWPRTNVHFCRELMRKAREAVLARRFEAFHREFLAEYRRERG